MIAHQQHPFPSQLIVPLPLQGQQAGLRRQSQDVQEHRMTMFGISLLQQQAHIK